ncbi:hypothetical protein [Clostridium formicaceticum]|uniref:Aminodeoxychorismate lyase n=1 Tax=Clostridium formicaceticum TaxID=1497 RepID=A0AAC9WFB5_9CLOT|nr:hypothetical protein [Clostridium formicaceticum]AOY76323.1 hypothetical protein BJL90_10660 [Clostridium formicaceticum]ARE86712.1 hypothetical protein CLFO_10390 [Clostridium formicaceticum]
MEKLKDLLHDFSDVFIAGIIASLMFGVVVFSLGDWFNTNSTAIAIDPLLEVHQQELAEKFSEEANTEANEEDAADEKDLVEVTVTEDKVITVPSGTPASGIATILLDNGLIENTNDFIKTAEELDLLLKLKSGTFTISANADLKDIVRIIAGDR